MSIDKATSRPWTAYNTRKGRNLKNWRIQGANRVMVCSFPDTWQGAADALAVERAVNSHEALREALADCITDEGAQCIATNDVAYLIRRLRAINSIARAALALAGA